MKTEESLLKDLLAMTIGKKKKKIIFLYVCLSSDMWSDVPLLKENGMSLCCLVILFVFF